MAIENTLLNVFAALEEKAVRYSLLRGFEELFEFAPIKEVDLLVDRSYLNTFTKIVRGFGFLPLPSWGYEPHCFFVAYDSRSHSWLKLDVVTDLVYGAPVRWLQADLADRCLEARQKQDPTYTLSPADEFATLLLHCLLDKGKFRAERRKGLKYFFELAKKDPSIEERITENLQTYMPRRLTWQKIARFVENNDWDCFLKYRKAISKKLFRLHPLGNIVRHIKTRLMRRLRPFLFLVRRRHHGLWIALLAPDGGGKTTLAHTLLTEQFLRARLIYMGTNLDSVTLGFPTTPWLKKHLRSLESKEKKWAIRVLKGLVYANRMLEQWYRVAAGMYYKFVGCTVVFDRFIYDSVLAAPATSGGQKIRRWLINKTCPQADMTFFLDAPGTVLYKRKREHSPAVLEKQRQTFLRLRAKIPNMVIVDATRPANEVRTQVLEKIWQFYGLRFNGNNQSAYENKN